MIKLNLDLLYFVLLALANYRVARMIAVEKGPLNLFENLRGWTAKKWHLDAAIGKQHWIDQGVNCPMCISFWSGFASAWVLGPTNVVEYVVIALALSAIVVILYRLVG